MKFREDILCPECHIGVVVPLDIDPEEPDIQMFECRSCGYMDVEDSFKTVKSSDMPPSSDPPSSEQYYGTPLKEGIHFWKETFSDESGEEEMIFTNVPHYFGDKSGFSWGYGGTGPARFSLNIIETVLRYRRFQGHTVRKSDFPGWNGLCFQFSWKLHQKFKDQFISRIPQNSEIIIPIKTVEEWLAENGVTLESGEGV